MNYAGKAVVANTTTIRIRLSKESHEKWQSGGPVLHQKVKRGSITTIGLLQSSSRQIL
jgi:hypothetical protein